MEQQGAVIGFMTWIWLSTIVVLIGAEFDTEMESRDARDTAGRPLTPTAAGNGTK